MFSVRCRMVIIILVLSTYADGKASAVHQDILYVDGVPISARPRPTKALVKDSPPFSYQLTNNTYGGIEIKLMEEIAKELNLKIEYIFDNGDSEINHKYVEKEIDVIIGGLSYGMANTIAEFSPTSPYYRDDITWCVKKADRFPLWLNIFVVFKNFGVALGLILLFFVSIGHFFALSAFERKPLNSHAALVTGFNILLGFGFPHSADRNGLRFIIFFYSIISILLGIHYTSYYTSFMITPKHESQVTSIEELIDGHFKLAGDIDAVLKLKLSEEVPIDLLNRYETCTNLDKCLERLITDKRLAVAISRQRATNNHVIHKSHLYCYDETQNINTYFVAMYVNNNYFARDQIHKLTKRFFESGFLTKWTMDINIIPIKMNNQTVKKISVDHILGAFFGCSFIFAWAVIQFILEILAHKRARRPNARRIWILLDHFHDIERHEWNFADGRNNGTKLGKAISSILSITLIIYIFLIMFC